MSIAYDSDYFPPIPVLPITLITETARLGPLEAILDTGADATIIPETLALELDALPANPAQIRTQWGETHPVTIFILDIQVMNILIPGAVVAGDPQAAEIILGRDVLNKLPLFLDGTTQQTEILDDAAVKRIRARRQ